MGAHIDIGMNYAIVGNREGRKLLSLAFYPEAYGFAAFGELFSPAHAPDKVYAFVRIHTDNSATLSTTPNAGMLANAPRG